MKAYEQAIRPSVTDVLFGRVTTASIISMLGLWTNPPAAAKQPPNMEELPAWYQASVAVTNPTWGVMPKRG